MSISNQISRITQAKQSLSLKGQYLGITQENDLLDIIATKLNSGLNLIQPQDIILVGNAEYVIPRGFHTGTGRVLSYIAQPYTVSFDLDGGVATPEVNNQIVLTGELAIEPTSVLTKDGFEFKGWFLEDILFDFNTPITQNVTLVAKWAKNVDLAKFYETSNDTLYLTNEFKSALQNKQNYVDGVTGEVLYVYPEPLPNPKGISSKYGGMFSGNLGILDLSKWDTSGIISMRNLFASSNIENLISPNWNTDSLTIATGMFHEANIPNVDLSNFNASNIVDIKFLFEDNKIENLNLSGFTIDNPSNTDAKRLVYNTTNLLTLNASSMNLSSVTDISEAFATVSGISSLTSLNLANCNVSNVKFMISTFSGCSALTSLDVSGWNTSNLQSLYTAFFGCSSLEVLDLSSWDLSNVNETGGMFVGCNNLTTVYVKNEVALNVLSTAGGNPSQIQFVIK